MKYSTQKLRVAVSIISVFTLQLVQATGDPGQAPALLLGPSPARTYVFSGPHWWESSEHQVTSLITHLSLAHNISAIAVIPYAAGGIGGPKSHYSLLGDFYDIEKIQNVQNVVAMDDFKSSSAYQDLRGIATAGSLTFPKSSHEMFERTLDVLSGVSKDAVSFGMPEVDPENSEHYCSAIPGTVHMSEDGRTRFVFVGRVHFYHFCTEKFMPWWYEVRLHLVPRPEYFAVVEKFVDSIPKPVTVVHVRDMLDHQTEREDEEIQRYAGQIADAIRRSNPRTEGTLYISYSETGRNSQRVASLFAAEYPSLKKCSDLYRCGRSVDPSLLDPQLQPEVHAALFETNLGASLVEVALSMRSDYFIGNLHSPYSRNVGLYRKLQGRQYEIIKGFAEQRKTWRWNL